MLASLGKFGMMWDCLTFTMCLFLATIKSFRTSLPGDLRMSRADSFKSTYYSLPLTDLSKKDAVFDWTPSRISAFDALQHALTTAPILAFPDPDKPFELVCDVSDFDLGAVLLQEGRPLGYYFGKMTAAERNYGH